MKKLSKRFLTLAIACVMAMAMAVPAFADWTIEVDDNSNRYINVYGTYGSSLNMRYLTLYKTSAPKSEQCFHLYRSIPFERLRGQFCSVCFYKLSVRNES